jgi:hypothetical protein
MKGCWFHASVIRLAAIAMALAVLPSVAHAQATASITGVVTDASGAVLPGVTVEASSPALIEKVRSVVTDGSGQYRLEQLRGGVYAVTFTLPGFNTIKREGLELAGSFAASVNAEMRVGSVEETVTVTGETPIVDIQSANRQRVINQELLEAIPTGRTPQVAAFMIPGVNLNNVDVGGTNIINTTGRLDVDPRRQPSATPGYSSTASPPPTPRVRGGRPTCSPTWAARRKWPWTTRRRAPRASPADC